MGIRSRGNMGPFCGKQLLVCKFDLDAVFSLFHGNVKKCVFNILGLGWFRMKEQISAFSEFCNVGARPVYALCVFGWLVHVGPCPRGTPRHDDDRHERRTPHLVHQNALWQTTGVGGQDRTAVLCFLFGHTTGMVPPRTPLARARTCHVATEHGLKCATTQCC
jgi:hypothetical protein